MQEDYREMMSSWRTMDAFKEVRQTLAKVPKAAKAMKIGKINKFLEAARAENIKMFCR
jgi:hypothetical protein